MELSDSERPSELPDRIVLYLASEEESRTNEVQLLLELCRTKGISVDIIGQSDARFDEQAALAAIRSIAPQVRGRVKSGRGYSLPLSNSGRLSLGNTPVAIVYSSGIPVDVYPKFRMGRYYKLTDLFLSPKRLGREELLIQIIESKPSLIDPEWTSVETEVQLASGRADLLIRSPSGLILVECKDQADQGALGQLLKQSTGLGAKLVLACFDAKEGIAEACREHGVYLVKLTLELQR
jgi:hypothetical protein